VNLINVAADERISVVCDARQFSLQRQRQLLSLAIFEF
jgi:hypothetical protein